MPVLPIYLYSQPALRKKARQVQRINADLTQFVEDMFETMRKANGIGLAANQVGSLQRVIVVDVSDMEETKDVKPIAMLNPVVVDEKGAWKMEEGCLSIPEIRDEVERAETIRVKFRDLEFKEQEIEAEGILARVILHEIDHLNGVLFIDHLDTARQKLLRGRLNKIRRGEVEVSYPIVAETVPAD